MFVIRKVFRFYFDENGFWIDLVVNYGGGARMIIEIKANLMKKIYCEIFYFKDNIKVLIMELFFYF